MTYKTELIETLDGWTVRFWIGVQGFTLDITQPRTKEEAEWYEKNVITALNNLVEGTEVSEPTTCDNGCNGDLGGGTTCLSADANFDKATCFDVNEDRWSTMKYCKKHGISSHSSKYGFCRICNRNEVGVDEKKEPETRILNLGMRPNYKGGVSEEEPNQEELWKELLFDWSLRNDRGIPETLKILVSKFHIQKLKK